MTFFTIVGNTEILCSLRLVLGGEKSKEIPESSRSEFLENFSANNFEIGHTVVNMMESRWKLRQQHDQNFPMEEKTF